MAHWTSKAWEKKREREREEREREVPYTIALAKERQRHFVQAAFAVGADVAYRSQDR